MPNKETIDKREREQKLIAEGIFNDSPTPVDVPPADYCGIVEVDPRDFTPDVSSELVERVAKAIALETVTFGPDYMKRVAQAAIAAMPDAARIAALEAVVEEVRRFRWKSADKDNMEFSTTVTYSQRDRLRTLLDKIGSS